MPKRRKTTRIVVLVALVAAFGASTPSAAPADDLLGPPLPGESAAGALHDLLAYFYYASVLPDDLLEREYRSLLVTQGHQPFADLRLAILLSVPGTRLEDPAQARALVAPYLAAHDQEDLVGRFAFFLDALLRDHEQRGQELRASQRKVETLQRQLEQLKLIERSINQGGDTTSLNERIEGTGSPGR